MTDNPPNPAQTPDTPNNPTPERACAGRSEGATGDGAMFLWSRVDLPAHYIAFAEGSVSPGGMVFPQWDALRGSVFAFIGKEST